MQPLTVLIGDRDYSDRLLKDGFFFLDRNTVQLNFNCPFPRLALLEAPVRVSIGPDLVYQGRVELVELDEDITHWRVIARTERTNEPEPEEKSMTTEDRPQRVLSLNLKDPAAHSIMFAYLHARGVESARPYTDDVLRIAQLLSDNPDLENHTATQAWEQFQTWATAIINVKEDALLGQCTLDEVELCIKGSGYEVAAVVIREISEKHREMWKEELDGYRKKLREKADTKLPSPDKEREGG